MPLRERYKFSWSSTSGAAKLNRLPAKSWRYDWTTKSWLIRRSSTATGGDIWVDVTDAEYIYGQASLVNSTKSSTSIDINVHAGWGSTGDPSSTGMEFSSSGHPYTSFNITTTSATAPNAQGGFLITPGPDFLRFRADSSSSGGHAVDGTQLIINVRNKQY